MFPSFALPRLAPVLLLAAAGLALAGPARGRQTERPLVVLLSETDPESERDGLPVFLRHAEPDSVAAGLSRGLSGLLFRVYRMEQDYLAALAGIEAEPAYVLLSGHTGGFARRGFVLGDTLKPETDYVDVHRDWPITGKFGALDQIVPHELAHVMRRQLAGEPVDGGTNQFHTLGMRTDRVVAFNEGFAEHLQAVAFDRSPDHPVLGRLAADSSKEAGAYDHLDSYRTEMSARFAPAPPMRLGFIAWYSNDEDVLRYHGIRDNVFAREPDIPPRLLSIDPFKAYLLESVLPGKPERPLKSVGRMASTEAVVASFFYRWAMDERIGARRVEPEFYAPFGVGPEDVTDLENTYLKMIEAMYRSKPQTTFDMVAGYVERFPEEGSWIDEIWGAVFHGPIEPPPPEHWMANRSFQTGTSIFDQFRGLGRTHTFDLNAASVVDLVAIPGVTPGLARKIMAGGPYAEIQDVSRIEGVSPDLVTRLSDMNREMAVLRAEAAEDSEETLSVSAILTPMILRAVLVVLVSAFTGLYLYVRMRRRFGIAALRRRRLVWNGLLIGLLGCAGGWALGLTGLGAIACVSLAAGLPAAVCHLTRREVRAAAGVLGAWVVAALPAAVLTGAWF